MRVLLALTVTLSLIPTASAAEIVEKGTFQVRPADNQKEVPARFRLDERPFAYEMDLKTTMPAIGVKVYRLRYPSPVKTSTPENNTVHAEYYVPQGKGPFPGVIVLDITGGNQALSRHISTYLASNGIAGLFVQMAYYGPRRPAGSKLRLMSPNLPHTVAAVTQTVLDLRVATAWLASRPELDPNRLGITGTSLGSFLSALTGSMEPRLGRVCVLLGGGGFIDGYASHPLAKPWIRMFELMGVSREAMKKVIEPIDPLTYASNLKNRKLLILAARQDEIVPPSMAQMLWEASGRQAIHWYDAGHYTAAFHLADALHHILEHFQAP
ncbi:MAG: alpha/beta hydrolase family protein [Gemmataceae bacterium]